MIPYLHYWASTYPSKFKKIFVGPTAKRLIRIISDSKYRNHTSMPNYFKDLHRVQKNCAKLFLSELRQISINFDNFWQKDGKEAKIM